MLWPQTEALEQGEFSGRPLAVVEVVMGVLVVLIEVEVKVGEV